MFTMTLTDRCRATRDVNMKNLSRCSTKIDRWLRAFAQSVVLIIFAVWINNIFLVKGGEFPFISIKPFCGFFALSYVVSFQCTENL